MGRDQFPDIEDIVRSDYPSPVLEFCHSTASMSQLFLERKGVEMFLGGFYLSAFTRRHIGAARTRDTSPAAISNCASYASSALAGELDSGHHRNLPWERRF